MRNSSPGQSAEVAETGELRSALELLLPALSQFTRFAEADPTPREQAVWSAQLDEPLPQRGVGMQETLELLGDVVIPHGIRTGAPGFCGWVTTAPTTVPAVAQLAAAIAGSQREWVHAFNFLEAVALKWLAELLGLPHEAYYGIFASGGAMANLLGLAAARQAMAERLGLDPAEEGVARIPTPRLYASTEVHSVISRAAAILGLGRSALCAIPTDAALRLDIGALRAQLARDRAAGCTPLAVVASAGTANTGAVDPLPDLVRLCHEQGIWLHVDGAYGLLGILDERVAPLYGDLSVADSLVLDPHKWLAAPVGCGSVFVREASLLRRAFTLTGASYLQQAEPHEEAILSAFESWGHPYGDYGLESSSPSRGCLVWAILKEIGAEGVRSRVCRHNDYARTLAALVVRSACLQLMAPITLSICCFRYVPVPLQGQDDEAATNLLNRLNREILRRMRGRGRCIPSSTVIGGNFVLRACYINPRTRHDEVEALVQEVEECGAEAWARVGGEEDTARSVSA